MEELLRAWLPRQRWFAGKSSAVHEARVREVRVLREDDPMLLHAFVEAVTESASQAPDCYHILLGARRTLPRHLDAARIGRSDEYGEIYDALHDPELTQHLLTAIHDDVERAGVRFRREPGAEFSPDAPGRLLSGEQSNTSVVFGDETILKIFRLLVPGVNPDLDVTRALTEAGSPHVAPLCGWMETDIAGEPYTLGILQRYLRTGSDGWSLALTSVRDLFAEGDLHAEEVGGDFAAEAERLGVATAEVHRTLAHVLPTATGGAEFVEQLTEAMRRRLQAAADVVPALAAHITEIQQIYDTFRRRTSELHLQRIHGDLHLGQVMRTEYGWVFFDFEGEPGARIEQRAALASPLRDVAGMLRSFDYAAHYLLAGHTVPPQLAYRAAEWSARNRAAFCIGYAKVADHDPREEDAVLRAFEVDKAVYETMYEMKNRPDWVGIPLGALERLLAAEHRGS
ncbi:aminoglycoside phosphotransferase [Acidothermus cellulolyticus 11B]|uniref:Maltokinase n=1 Tax=Acidothermus cellulolyticus (strain ATCC 43068 / DSM 8971 / 11B) TaxID=351607 RepID=A0LSP0_ACIC1|nr:phosphotransferase [Acidothermus cellulolyticus]ABK52450.1 aminoglycoside phosphotransferase [Acidothermus cellulolyticus 11B]